jgi:L-threonylcarbamoyladenylate synthase
VTPPVHLDAIDDPEAAVDQVVEALLGGGVVVVPTDTVYGLAALPGDAAAIGRVFDLKGRAHDTPMAVLCADVRQAVGLVDPERAAEVQQVGERWWPGPLTLVCGRRPGVEVHLGEPTTTIGLRVPDHPLLRAVAARVGPVAATSANRHGEPTAVTAEEALLDFADGVDLVVDEGPIEGRASTVVDTTRTPWHVLREGPISAADVLGSREVPLL